MTKAGQALILAGIKKLPKACPHVNGEKKNLQSNTIVRRSRHQIKI